MSTTVQSKIAIEQLDILEARMCWEDIIQKDPTKTYFVFGTRVSAVEVAATASRVLGIAKKYINQLPGPIKCGYENMPVTYAIDTQELQPLYNIFSSRGITISASRLGMITRGSQHAVMEISIEFSPELMKKLTAIPAFVL